MPKEELDYLRKEVERLKRNPLGSTKEAENLLDAVHHLNENITTLVQIFQGANDEMLKMFHDKSLQDQMRKIREENAKIAHGIVAVAELVKGLEKQRGEPLPHIEDLSTQRRPAPPPMIFNPQEIASEFHQEPPVQRSPNPFFEQETFHERQIPYAGGATIPRHAENIAPMEVPPPPPRKS